MTTQNRTRRPKRSTGGLKILLLASSVLTSLAGTQLLNIQAALQPAAAVADTQVTAPAPQEPQFELVVVASADGRQQVALRQIQQTGQPQMRPIARSRSSN